MSFHKLANVLAIMWTCIWTAKCWGVGEETVKTGCGSMEACQRLGGGHNNCITFRIPKSILNLHESRCRECSSGSVIFPPQTKMKSWFPTQFQQILNMTSFMAAGLLHWHAWQSAGVFLGVFFQIDNRQPKHVILSAIQLCSQRTRWAGMQCCPPLQNQ